MGGTRDRLGTALRPQLAQYGVDVELDRMLADAQTAGNGLVRQPFGHQSEDLQLPPGQLNVRGLQSIVARLCGKRRQIRLDDRQPLHDD